MHEEISRRINLTTHHLGISGVHVSYCFFVTRSILRALGKLEHHFWCYTSTFTRIAGNILDKAPCSIAASLAVLH
jgi:hypothetical protein